MAAEPSFWDNPERAQKNLRETKDTKRVVHTFDSLASQVTDAKVYLELAQEENDDEAQHEATRLVAEITQQLADLEFQRMLSGESDSSGAIVDINSGAGGVDASDWAQMLLRMVLRYAERKGWRSEILDETVAEEAGIKSATVAIDGEFAYGMLKAEAGVHRLVRISPFDSNARRHTSFASISIVPDVDDDIDIVVSESDLRIDVYRASGAGGQHVNKTESAVRITHLPTNIVSQCQSERSQHKNKAKAMRVLKARLHEHELQSRMQEKQKAEAQKKKIEWGSQIRSYVLAPYRQVNDHRTEVKTSRVDDVLDGDLDELIRTYLLQTSG